MMASHAYAESERGMNSLRNAQYETQFNTNLFAKCNVCHKPFESTVVGSRTVPSYRAISQMERTAIARGIEHEGHLSSDGKSKIYSVLHPEEKPRKVAGKKTSKKSLKKAKKKAKKTGKSKKRK